MDNLRFDSVLKCRLYRIIGGISALGKVEFQNFTTNDGCMLSQSTEIIFDLAANLLSLDRKRLTEVLTTRSIQPKGQCQNVIV